MKNNLIYIAAHIWWVSWLSLGGVYMGSLIGALLEEGTAKGDIAYYAIFSLLFLQVARDGVMWVIARHKKELDQEIAEIEDEIASMVQGLKR